MPPSCCFELPFTRTIAGHLPAHSSIYFWLIVRGAGRRGRHALSSTLSGFYIRDLLVRSVLMRTETREASKVSSLVPTCPYYKQMHCPHGSPNLFC